jgi:predicted ester cyclase
MGTIEEQNKAIVANYLQEMDRGNTAVLREVLAHDAIIHFPGFPPMDVQATVQGAEMFYAAFPDLSHNIDDLIAEGDKVVLRATDRGTHQGEFQGIAPTGKYVTITLIAIYRIAGGKIVEMWEEIDMLGLLQQIGATVQPPSP